MIYEKLQIAGFVSVTVRDLDGRVVKRHSGKNLVVNTGREAIALLVGAANTAKQVVTFGAGEDGAPATLSDTALASAYTNTIAGVTYPAINQLQFTAQLGSTEANGKNIEEIGLICSDGTLFARYVNISVAKTSSLVIDVTWTITI